MVDNCKDNFGGITVTMEPWHADITTFLESKTMDKTSRLNYTVWIPDILCVSRFDIGIMLMCVIYQHAQSRTQ